MKTKNSLFKLFRIANLHYKKFARKLLNGKQKETPQPLPYPSTLYSHKIYANISDYYLNNPSNFIFRSLEQEYSSEEIRKIQNFINSLSLKSATGENVKKEKIDFDNIQNYVANTNYTIR